MSLPDCINIQRPNEINDYLSRFPDMIDITRSICERVLEYFNKDTQFTLELYSDPEIEDEYLTLYIRQAQYDEEIMFQIEKINMEYDKDLSEKSGWILITSDFKHLQ